MFRFHKVLRNCIFLHLSSFQLLQINSLPSYCFVILFLLFRTNPKGTFLRNSSIFRLHSMKNDTVLILHNLKSRCKQNENNKKKKKKKKKKTYEFDNKTYIAMCIVLDTFFL
jgi:hypothetical protein